MRYPVRSSGASIGLVRPITNTYEVEAPLGPLSTVPVRNPSRAGLVRVNTPAVWLPPYFPQLDPTDPQTGRGDPYLQGASGRYSGGWWTGPPAKQ